MVIKEVANAAVGTAKWAAPIISSPDVDSQLEKAMGRSDIKEAYQTYEGDPLNFRNSLRGYIERENQGNYTLDKTARFMDSFNKATVPIDSALDYFNIMGGIGSAARGLKTLASLPGYLGYDLYYLGKTGDIVGTLENIGYEGISWLMLGSLPHLLNYYTRQAQNYTVENASSKFLKGLEEKASEKMKPKEKLKGEEQEDLESLATAA